MEFPQLNKYDSLIEKHLNPSCSSFQPYTYDPCPINPHNLNELLSDIDEINVARSYSVKRLNEAMHFSSTKLKSNQSSEETLECDFADSRTYKSERSERSKKSNRSLIFANQNFSKNKQLKKPGEMSIRIYYFELPINKRITYNNTTKISDLIKNAINAYLEDKTLDASKIKEREFENYQIRLPKNQEGFHADLSIPAVSYERFVIQNMFDNLVLLAKPKLEEKNSENYRIQNKKPHNKNGVTISLFNQLGEQLGSLTMASSDSLQTIFQHIQSKDLLKTNSYYLTQNKHDLDGLPRDFQVKNLQSNKLFIKVKKYIDDCEWDNKVKPIKHLTFLSKEPQIVIPLPIGLNEASQYQEFSVIKVNSLGFEQQRIFGIDQTKIYNYDKQFRQQKRKTSFLGKIFGRNEFSGTKKPYRLIEDIIDLKKTENGLYIIYKQKPINYIVKDLEIRDKIFRKLNFLINHSKQQKSNINRFIKH